MPGPWLGRMDRQIAEDELARCDGRDGRPAWIACKGKVYDVSGSRLWPGGIHMRRHQVGRDLTGDFAVAPHDESVLNRLPVVGSLAGATPKGLPGVVQLYLDLHPHPVSVHFPIALTLASAIFLVIYLAGGTEGLADAAHYTLLGAAAIAPLSALTGAASWWFNFGRRLTGTFAGKAALSAVLVPIQVVTAVLWSLNRQAVEEKEAVGWVCLALLLVMSALVLSLGKLGGALVFPPRRRPGSKAH